MININLFENAFALKIFLLIYAVRIAYFFKTDKRLFLEYTIFIYSTPAKSKSGI